jgi:hypothetical protein
MIGKNLTEGEKEILTFSSKQESHKVPEGRSFCHPRTCTKYNSVQAYIHFPGATTSAYTCGGLVLLPQ